MFDFNKITIDQLSKTDLLAILQALDYTYEHNKIENFRILKDHSFRYVLNSRYSKSGRTVGSFDEID